MQRRQRWPRPPASRCVKVHADKVDVFYGEKQALKAVSIDIPERSVTAFIGPSGCGKSTFLRCINRMNDTIEGCRVTGEILIDGEDIYDPALDVVELRARVGMVFQKPNPFPKSIFENVAYGPRIHGLSRSKAELDEIVEASLKRAGLWEEVKDRLADPGTGLSGGQQQRLCIARAIAVSPEVILMDEPCSALDPIATAAHRGADRRAARPTSPSSSSPTRCSRRRASRRRPPSSISASWSRPAPTEQIFTNPSDKRTQDYITGRFG